MKIALCFSQYGPYHHARARALRGTVGRNEFVAVQIAAGSRTYAWNQATEGNVDVVTLCGGEEEDAGFLEVFLAALRLWKREKVTAALLPSYSPATSLALLLAAKVAGLRCVMMNESHAGTERAKGLKRVIKRWLIARFHAALVGGLPQKRHFTALGMHPETIFTGYDAIDNEFFAHESTEVRQDAESWRARLGLPQRYILSLGRLVEKKNLGCLVDAYAALRQRLGSNAPALVFVGSGDQKHILRDQCAKLGLRVAEGGQAPTAPQADVLFFGFRQISENPAFYALTECFVLPSLWEEWGLVVNEAMACGLPVVASKTVGSAEDLVRHGENGFQFDPSSPQELTDALTSLATDPALRERMGAESRQIISHWGCDNFAQNALLAVLARS